MDFKKGQEYIDLLDSGASEEALLSQYGIEYEELYAVIAFRDQRYASEKLKNFCRGCANDLCFCWPGRDETPCPARGYEPHCPLNKRSA